jgi:hypothetical protein
VRQQRRSKTNGLTWDMKSFCRKRPTSQSCVHSGSLSKRCYNIYLAFPLCVSHVALTRRHLTHVASAGNSGAEASAAGRAPDPRTLGG